MNLDPGFIHFVEGMAAISFGATLLGTIADKLEFTQSERRQPFYNALIAVVVLVALHAVWP